MLYETSHDTMSHFVTCGIYSGGMAGMWNPHKAKRDRAHARFVLFLSSLTRNLGDGRGLLLRDNMYKVWRKCTREWPDAKFTTFVAPMRSCAVHRMSQLRGRWLLPLPVKALITSNLISTRRARLIYSDDGPPFNLGGELPWPGFYTHWPTLGPIQYGPRSPHRPQLSNTCICADWLHARECCPSGEWCTLHSTV